MIVMLCTISFAYAQTTIRGTVKDKNTQENLPGVTVNIKGRTIGTSTNNEGKFALITSLSFPLIIVVNYVGYTPYEQNVSSADDNLIISLEQAAMLGQEVVIAASRMPERILEAPVSIERMNVMAIQETAAPSFYDALSNFKGVESSVQSLTFRSLSTRGFNANGNVRFNQFTDGMDNQAPGLNFPVGNIAGIPDIDAESAEILPGASSALYGAGGMNGTLLITSKNPFQYQGLSMTLKRGVNHVEQNQHIRSDYVDMSMRYAKAWNNKTAFKVAFSWLEGQDWQADDYSNYDRPGGMPKSGNRDSDPLYDGVNVYGDEPNAGYPTLQAVAQAAQAKIRTGVLAATNNMLDVVARMNMLLPANASAMQIATFIGNLPVAVRPSVQQLVPFYFGLRNNLIPNQSVTRTGYEEKDLIDYGSKSLKTVGEFRYKLSDKIEAIAQANWGQGTTVYTAYNGRVSLSGFSIGRYKLELKGDNFFIRGYTTQERSGKSYNASLLGVYLNEYSTPASSWFPEYTTVYANSKNAGLTDAEANIAARQYADRNRPQPGTPAFDILKNDINSRTVGLAGGSKFNDRSNLNQVEGMYNFSGLLDNKFELQTGLSYRAFNLHSNGTIFDDLDRNIIINEFGAFVQAGKKIWDDKLKVNAAVRYDKSENFEGRFTPRISGVYTVGKNKNIRASYQTGFRNPTTQNQYIDIVIGGSGGLSLIGGVPELLEKYNLITNKGYTQSSVNKFRQSGLATDLQLYTFNKFKPESVQAYELGYKALYGNKFLLDAYYFYNSYTNFISTLVLLQPTTTMSPTDPLGSARTISTTVNNPETVTAQGAALGLDYLGKKYNFNGSISYNKLNNSNIDFKSEFNTPKLHVNVGVSAREILQRVGFNLNYRWQDKYNWSSTFVVGEVKAFGTIDAQVNYKLPFYNSLIKFGASNILNRYYITSSGNPSVGGVYYISLIFDQFLR